jgi:hypothetical protein
VIDGELGSCPARRRSASVPASRICSAGAGWNVPARHLSRGRARSRNRQLTSPERKMAAGLRCEECGCVSENARDWIAHIVYEDDDQALRPTSSPTALSALLEFHRALRSRYT